ncbi:MAG TPA: PIN domain-containing protein [Solirubrobacteraceae bacterium]|nr:PIN domain-containing protein [Solirubrobacteraceae bacterium]
MAVAVFDSDVVIGFLNADDAHHGAAVEMVREALVPGTRRMLSAVNYSEILIGPIKAGKEARDHVDHMIGQFAIEIMIVDMPFAQRAAAVRARTGLKLPDAYALATAIHAEHRGYEDVRLLSFDAAVMRAHAELHPN